MLRTNVKTKTTSYLRLSQIYLFAIVFFNEIKGYGILILRSINIIIMKKNFISIIMLGICQLVIGQEFKEKSFLSFFNNPSEKVYGISTGLIQQRIQPDGFTSTTYGLRLEPLGKGFSILFVPEIGFPQDSLKFEKHFRYKPTEVVNGLAVSGGYISFADVNGISISGGVQALRKVNGVSFSGYDNYAYKSNGLHLSLNASVAYHSANACG